MHPVAHSGDNFLSLRMRSGYLGKFDMLVQTQHAPESVFDFIENRQESLITGGRHASTYSLPSPLGAAGGDTTVQLLVCRAWYIGHVLTAVGPR